MKKITLSLLLGFSLYASTLHHEQKPQQIKPEANTVTIAQLFKNRDAYAGKKITLKGKVTKVSKNIMKLNWIHIQDGSRFKNMDDLVFTSAKPAPKVGDIVYAKGTVIKDKDFGYGYFYPLIIQDATFSK